MFIQHQFHEEVGFYQQFSSKWITLMDNYALCKAFSQGTIQIHSHGEIITIFLCVHYVIYILFVFFYLRIFLFSIYQLLLFQIIDSALLYALCSLTIINLSVMSTTIRCSHNFRRYCSSVVIKRYFTSLSWFLIQITYYPNMHIIQYLSSTMALSSEYLLSMLIR